MHKILSSLHKYCEWYMVSLKIAYSLCYLVAHYSQKLLLSLNYSFSLSVLKNFYQGPE